MQRIQNTRRSRGRTRNGATAGIVTAFPPSDGERDAQDWEP
jgi:hypothetical protein